MRKLFWLVVVAAALWSGYWALASRGISAGLSAWLEDRAAEGWQAEASRISTRGFPVAFETTVTGLALADPETGLAWAAPSFSFSADAWAPTDVRAVWPERQRLSTPFEHIDIRSGAFTARLALSPAANFALRASDVTLRDVTWVSTGGWTAALGDGRLTTNRSPDDPLTHAIRFFATDFTPAEPLILALDPTGRLPRTVSRMELDLSASFDAPWDRRAIEERRPQPTVLDLRLLRARWGDMDLEAAGAMTIDAEGMPEGRITVRATNWREMLRIARNSGIVPEALETTIERALELLAGLSGNPETIDAPLSFQNGFVSFGPIPLGRAPLLTIR